MPSRKSRATSITAAAMTKKLNIRNRTLKGVAPTEASMPRRFSGSTAKPALDGFSWPPIRSVRVSTVAVWLGTTRKEVVCPNRLPQRRWPVVSETNALGVRPCWR